MDRWVEGRRIEDSGGYYGSFIGFAAVALSLR